MCRDFIFDWFSFMLFYVSLYPLFCFILSALLLLWLTSLFHPLWLSSLPLAHSSLCHCLVFSLVLSLSFSFCCVFLLLLRFVVSFVVCFVRVLFVAVLLSLRSLTHVFFLGPVIRYTLTHQLACSLSVSFSLSLYCQCLWLCALSVCCSCLLEVKDKLMNDLIFCNSLYTIFLYIFFSSVVVVEGAKEGFGVVGYKHFSDFLITFVDSYRRCLLF